MGETSYTKITRRQAKDLAAWSLPVSAFDPDGTEHAIPGIGSEFTLPFENPGVPDRLKSGGWYGVPNRTVMVHLEFQDHSNPYIYRGHPLDVMSNLRKWRKQAPLEVLKSREDGHGILYLFVRN